MMPYRRRHAPLLLLLLAACAVAGASPSQAATEQKPAAKGAAAKPPAADAGSGTAPARTLSPDQMRQRQAALNSYPHHKQNIARMLEDNAHYRTVWDDG